MELKSLFIDCNDQLAPVWKRVVRAEDPPIDVNRAAFAPAELSRLLNGYDICIDDHSYLPTALVEQCDATRANGMRPALFSLRSTAGSPKDDTLDLKEAKALLDELAA
jgi:hypothetical protein